MSKIVIFGTAQLAELGNYYLSSDTEHTVVAFTVHEDFLTEETFLGKPVVSFEGLTGRYPPGEFKLFAPMTGKGLNKIREKVYLQGKSMGYEFVSYVSSRATVLNEVIGENCFILEDNTIQPFVEIGNNCVLWSGNHIGHSSKIEDSVFVTSHVVISGNCVIGKYSWLGVNATFRNNLKIAEGTLVGMASCITRDTAPYTVYMGVPGKPRGSSNEDKIKNSL